MLSVGAAYGIILGCCALGILYGILNFLRVRKVDLHAHGSRGELNTSNIPLSREMADHELEKEKVDTMLQIGEYISEV